jgi:hypothetical protein
MSNEALIAAFLAKGGKVAKIDAGVQALNLSAGEWRRQTQLTKAERQGVTLDAEQQAERRHELACDFARVGDRQAAAEAAGGAYDR